jgi:hypothetical protein
MMKGPYTIARSSMCVYHGRHEEVCALRTTHAIAAIVIFVVSPSSSGLKTQTH